MIPCSKIPLKMAHWPLIWWRNAPALMKRNVSLLPSQDSTTGTLLEPDPSNTLYSLSYIDIIKY